MQRRAASQLFSYLGTRSAAPGVGAAAVASSVAPCPAYCAAAGGSTYYPGAPAPAHTRCFSAAAAEPSAAKSTTNVPLGHHGSDLSSVACHIGLGRRRDLTMREDLALWKNGATRIKLADVFRGNKALLVGFPGGKVCTEKHIPGYVQAIPELKAAGVDKVVCVTVGDPEAVCKWARENGFDKDDMTLCVLADKDQCFMRMLGLELSESGPPCQRFAGVVDNGILLRLKVEGTPGDLKLTAVQSMLAEFKQFFDN